MGDSIRGSADMNDGQGLGALESHAKMPRVRRRPVAATLRPQRNLLERVRVARSEQLYEQMRFHLFEASDKAGLNSLALAYGLGCSGPVVVELVPR